MTYVRNIDIRDIIWLAGYLEGEGCFAAQKDSRCKDSYTLRISVGSIDKDIIRKASMIMLNDIRYNIVNDKLNVKTSKFYQFRINGNLAASWMMTLYPLMGERRKVAIKLALDIWKRKRIA